MADSKLTGLGAITDAQTGDEFYIVRGGVSFRISKENLLLMSLERNLAGALPVIGDITTMIARERLLGIGASGSVFDIYRRVVSAGTLDDFNIVELSRS